MSSTGVDARGAILVPVDFEGGSDRALALAKELGAALGAEVVLVHVQQLPLYTYPGLEPAVLPTYNAEIAAAAQRALDELARTSGGLRAVLRQGDPAAE